ncbi:hypothetical protein FB45DRAFT_482637 [Roridomyces roridus]|uniref:Uncharacterized protein n=1 Tax=Roridomyces roridus TaxID=1738132 RepID=A0AAD7FPB4_9AGAR|nr:hypothetical protein FB45DRAFT_482637 [Roridomyces roridus]
MLLAWPTRHHPMSLVHLPTPPPRTPYTRNKQCRWSMWNFCAISQASYSRRLPQDSRPATVRKPGVRGIELLLSVLCSSPNCLSHTPWSSDAHNRLSAGSLTIHNPRPPWTYPAKNSPRAPPSHYRARDRACPVLRPTFHRDSMLMALLNPARARMWPHIPRPPYVRNPSRGSLATRLIVDEMEVKSRRAEVEPFVRIGNLRRPMSIYTGGQCSIWLH